MKQAVGKSADARRATWPVLMMFLAPALLIYAAMIAYPACKTIVDGFFSIDNPDEPHFVGMANYRQL